MSRRDIRAHVGELLISGFDGLTMLQSPTLSGDGQRIVFSAIEARGRMDLYLVHLKDGKPLSALPKIVVVPITIWDAKNVAKYVDPLKRKIKVGKVPPAWIAKK